MKNALKETKDLIDRALLGSNSIKEKMMERLVDLSTKEGIKGIYKGVSMAITGVFMATGLTLGTYDFLKKNVITDKTPFL